VKDTGKVLILSALVCPGAGHVYLKRYIRAGVLIAIVSVALFFIVLHAVDIAQVVADKIILGEMALDPWLIRQEIYNQRGEGGKTADLAMGVFAATWLVALIDSYRIASRQLPSPNN